MAAEGLESTKRKKEGKKKEGREGGSTIGQVAVSVL